MDMEKIWDYGCQRQIHYPFPGDGDGAGKESPWKAGTWPEGESPLGERPVIFGVLWIQIP